MRQGRLLLVYAFAVSHPLAQPKALRDNHDHSFDGTKPCWCVGCCEQTFVGYVETASPRKHNPGVSFNDARKAERSFTELPNDFSLWPTVASVISAPMRPAPHKGDGTIETPFSAVGFAEHRAAAPCAPSDPGTASTTSKLGFPNPML